MSWWDWMCKQVLADKASSAKQSEQVGGRSLEEWETGWRRIGLLSSAHVTAPQETDGLFRLRLGQEIVYLGRSDRANANCLRRTLRALTSGGSENDSPLDLQLRERGHELAVEILITGSDSHARKLEASWLQQTRPAWNQLAPPPAVLGGAATTAADRGLHPG